MSAAIQYFV